MSLGTELYLDSNLECRALHHLNLTAQDRCAFVRNTTTCHSGEGFIFYTLFLFCDCFPFLKAGIILLIIWWLFLFIGLSVIADDFLCPSLTVITKTFRLSQNIAGVTFLAFGNGAPDIFSAIAAVSRSRSGNDSLAIGALFGAGMFVTTIVAGSIAIISPFHVMERPLLRDLIFYIAAVFWSFSLLWKGSISQLEAIGFILLYCLYAVIVVVGRYIRLKFELGDKNESVCTNSSTDQQPKDSNESDKLLSSTLAESSDMTDVDETSPLVPAKSSSKCQFLTCINPFKYTDWDNMKWYQKIWYLCQVPIIFLLLITVPLVDYNCQKNNWNRHLNSLHIVTGTLFFLLATDIFTKHFGFIPVWVIVIPISIIIASVVFAATSDDPPKYHAVYSFLGFLLSVVWISLVANEVVTLILTFGIYFNISETILGLTLLAWGNSLGDFISDISVSRHGQPRTAISAVFGGQMFNLLIGIGIPFTITTTLYHSHYKLEATFQQILLAIFLGISLLSTFIVMPIMKFQMTRGYGFYLLTLYLLFIVTILLAEYQIIPTPNWFT